MHNNSLVSIEDLTNEEIEDVLDLADDMRQNLRSFSSLASSYIMASLFFEPSTRTRGSFESAMHRLGGSIITATGVGSSSINKGETLSDTARVWSSYSDLLVVRHPWEGAAKLMVDYASVPVINGGDGGHEHPTQTLCDLYTLRSEKGSLDGLKVALCGDLKHGRTIHSLIFGLLRFGAELFFVPGEGLDLPEQIRAKIEMEYDRPIEKIPAGDFAALYGSPEESSHLDALYMTPNKPHMSTLFGDESDVRFANSPGQELVLYVTRRQIERESISNTRKGTPRRYPRISKSVMRKGFTKSTVLHPLPRVDEVSRDMDEDGRSRYFAQASYGVPVRMALISLLLGLKPWRKAQNASGIATSKGLVSVFAQGIRCGNATCVLNKEPGSCERTFWVFPKPQIRFTCRYCGWETRPQYYGMQQSKKKIYKSIDQLQLISQQQLFQFKFFDTEEQAVKEGYMSIEGRKYNNMSVFEVKD